jgi:methylated-DNA-[protein]-cysteine S-methyltransferase
MKSLYYTVFETRMGWMGVSASRAGLLRISLPCSSPEEAQKGIGETTGSVCSSAKFSGLIKRLKDYINGSYVDFPEGLDLSEATELQKEVWNCARTIPYGETRNYGWIADSIIKPDAQRAVGQALGKNPLPIIIPCHRVLAANNKLGGFSRGLEMKKRLLSIERIAYKPY